MPTKRKKPLDTSSLAAFLPPDIPVEGGKWWVPGQGSNEVPTPVGSLMTAAEARERVDQIKSQFGEIRKLVLDLFERKGWEALGYGSWRECVITEFTESQAHLYRLLDAAKIEKDLSQGVENQNAISPNGETAPIPEGVLRPLSKLKEPEKRRTAWKKATENNPKPTAREVAKAVAEVNETAPVQDPPVGAPAPTSAIISFPRNTKRDVPPTSAEAEAKSAQPAFDNSQAEYIDRLEESLGDLTRARNRLKPVALRRDGIDVILQLIEKASKALCNKAESAKIKTPPLPEWGAPRKSKWLEITHTEIKLGKIRRYTVDRETGKRIFDDELEEKAKTPTGDNGGG
jgi:hypothetical protein